MDWKVLFWENWEIIIGSAVLLSVLFLLFFVVVREGKIKTQEQKNDKNLLTCPIRGTLKTKKYDIEGNYTEEYQRIRLIKYLIRKKGCPKSVFRFEYPLEKSFGHQGHNKVRILVDLVLEKEGQIWIVAEIKKSYHPEKKRSAIEHQLKPAMEWTRSKYGIYFDGTKKSCLLSRNIDGTLSVWKFP